MPGEFRLGWWLIEPELGRISDGEVSRRIRPLPMKVLCRLARDPGTLCSREQLLCEIWGEETHINEEALSRVVYELRQALGDSARSPVFIETIPRRGYRLVAPVDPPVPEPEVEQAPSRSEVWGRRWRPLLATSVSFLVVALVAALTTRTRSPAESKARAPDLATVDVYSVARLDVELADGGGILPEEDERAFTVLLQDELAGIYEVSGEERPTASVTHRLETLFVTEQIGPVLLARLEHVASGDLVYSTRLALGSERDLSGVANELTSELTSFAALAEIGFFRDPDLKPWASIGRHDIHAVRSFAIGTQYIYRHEIGGGRHLLDAAELDPGFVAPRVWMLPALLAAGDVEKIAEFIEELEEVENQATPFERAMIGYAKAMRDDDLARQIRELEVARQVAPDNNIVLVNLGMRRYQLGDCQGALQALEGPIESWRFPGTYAVAARCAIRLGRLDRASRILESGLAAEPVDPEVLALLEAVALYRGHEELARDYRERAAIRIREMLPESVEIDLAPVYRRLTELAQEEGRTLVAARLREEAQAG